MITKTRIRRTLLTVVRILRTDKTELSKADSKQFADILELSVNLYCSDAAYECATLIINGQPQKCRIAKLPPNVTWVKDQDGVYYINIDHLPKK